MTMTRIRVHGGPSQETRIRAVHAGSRPILTRKGVNREHVRRGPRTNAGHKSLASAPGQRMLLGPIARLGS
jgi:hypothetical protein